MIAVRLHDVFSLKSNIYIGLFHERFVRNSRNREAMSFLPFPSLIFGTTEPISIVFGVRSLNADESMKLIKQFRNSYGIWWEEVIHYIVNVKYTRIENRFHWNINMNEINTQHIKNVTSDLKNDLPYCV